MAGPSTALEALGMIESKFGSVALLHPAGKRPVNAKAKIPASAS